MPAQNNFANLKNNQINLMCQIIFNSKDVESRLGSKLLGHRNGKIPSNDGKDIV